MHSIKQVLSEAAQSLQKISDSALLDTEILLSLTLGTSRSYLRAWPERTLQSAQYQKFLTLLQERQKGTPIAYITGVREFWSREFIVTPDVLIPRPETELLIELSLNVIAAGQTAKIIDLGTGSGVIAITLAAERPHAQVCASDNSPAALRIAERNAVKHGITNIRFYLSEWFASIPTGQYSLIVSNPPYIAPNDSHLHEGDLRFEPTSALCAAEQGLGAIRCIADEARHCLEPGGHLLIEHGYDQQQAVKAIFANFNYKNVITHTDLSGQPRVTYGQNAAYQFILR
jgi:release factor glutamine methyltransferase